MLRVATTARPIEKAQARLLRKLREKADKRVKMRVGFQGDSMEVTAYWSSSLGLWMCSSNMDNRYWNAFGLVEPESGGTYSITCEINLPYEPNRKVAGIVACRGDKPLIIAHRGNIGGGRRGIGKSHFSIHYQGEWATFDEDGGPVRAALIGALENDDLPWQLASFVREVHRLKELAVKGDQVGGADKGSFSDEFSGTREYDLAGRVSAQCNHGIVVNQLRCALEAIGLRVTNDLHRDLFCSGGNLLFEVKTSATLSDVYTALGQLRFHGLEPRTRHVLVLPNDVTRDVRNRLTKIHVDLVTYALEDGRASFYGLDTLNNSQSSI